MTTFVLILWAVAATALFVREKFFVDRGSAIFVCTSRVMQLAMVRLCEHFGIKPMFKLDTPGIIQRAFLSNGWIFNHVLDPGLLARMGNPRAAFALVVDDPGISAGSAMALLRAQGMHDVTLMDNIDPGVPSGSLYGVKFGEGEDRFCIIFRRHFMKMGGKPPVWNWKEIES